MFPKFMYNPWFSVVVMIGAGVYVTSSNHWTKKVDWDNDGFSVQEGDCNDSDRRVFPADKETRCDHIDDNCDGKIDNGVQTTWYHDADRDGYGNSAEQTTACTAPPWYVGRGNDCDDKKNERKPGRTEQCNRIDDDCNGNVDEGLKKTIPWFRDEDQDGYGSKNSRDTIVLCDEHYNNPPHGYVDNEEDCDDKDVYRSPNTDEVCDRIDNDCDGRVDEDVERVPYYRDRDDDGYGAGNAVGRTCGNEELKEGLVYDNTDCNDRFPAIHPEACDLWDGVDQNCNGADDHELSCDQTQQ